ncbi:MAG: hypothetical protein HYS98_08575 [Deltaproteobacteria bacterium]|nr:hypothetical protein [Deltaproteobacteria bacterium]
MNKNKEFEVVMNAESYGYALNIKINSIDLELESALAEMEGGASHSQRLFSNNHSMLASAPKESRDEAQKFFCLKEGHNQVDITYTKKEESPQGLKIEILMEGLATPIFLLFKFNDEIGQKKSIRKTITVYSDVKKQVPTVFVGPGPHDEGAYISLSGSSCMISPILNGDMELTTSTLGIEYPTVIPFQNTHSGENILDLNFKCEDKDTSKLQLTLGTHKSVQNYDINLSDPKNSQKKIKFEL